jgi:tRNA pseudouridine38-40 synthase
MQQAANELLGERDFASFTNALQVGEPTMRHLMRCSVNSYKNFVVVRMEANAFLRGMVRNTVGTLIQVGSGTRSVESMAELLHQRDRRMAGPSAVPEGLCLVKVKYGARRDYVKTQAQMIPSNLDGSP